MATYEEEMAKKRQEEEERKIKANTEKAEREAQTKSAMKEVEKGSKDAYENVARGTKFAFLGDRRSIGKQFIDWIKTPSAKKEYEEKALVSKPVGASDIQDIQKEAKAREEIHKTEIEMQKAEREKELQKNKGSIIKNSVIPKADKGQAVSNVIGEKSKEILEKNGKSNFQNKDDAHISESSDSVNTQLDKQNEIDWESTLKNIEKSGESYKQIDDKYIQNLPSFLIHSFAKGEFGNPDGADAKLRLAYFVANGLQSQLKNISNAANVAAGRSPLYQDTQSDWEKIKDTNMAKGLQQKWKKNEEEMQSAVDLVKKRGIDNESARSLISQIQTNNALASNFNRMNADQKAYLIEVYKNVGELLGDYDLNKYTSYLTGVATVGDNTLDPKTAATILGVKIAQDTGAIDKAQEFLNELSPAVKSALMKK